ncbi:MAG: alanine--glyoxylate aminotransferase family protein [Lentisphaeria bacterium]|nr:alanine--glyoxylate aminotransferase family protein [Candidatus Neomarinimicrobiota bacterium]MCF7842999.1 alanine--glyoxylate aminotransferase family protein [Lentisphaeria bacterium]
MNRKKLFIPGPTHVLDDTLQAMAQYPMGHRSQAYKDLHLKVVAGIQKVLFTEQTILLSTSSATGLMEAAVRNLVHKRAANFTCGAFSERWAEITDLCGLPQDTFQVDWGLANRPEQIQAALETGRYDVVTVVHNETSTGVANPMAEIAAVVSTFPDVLLCVDAVSGMAGLPFYFDEWGVDVVFASVQKAWALPPGFSVMAISDKALARAEQTPTAQKGFYFDLNRLAKSGAKGQTPITPSIPHLYGLESQLERMAAETLETRFQRHREMAQRTRDWGVDRFGLFAERGYESDTVTCFSNRQGIDLSKMIQLADREGFIVSGGYGDLKGKTFRIGHMGEHTLAGLEELLGVLDAILAKMKGAHSK